MPFSLKDYFFLEYTKIIFSLLSMKISHSLTNYHHYYSSPKYY